jgi:hypothetical protein
MLRFERPVDDIRVANGNLPQRQRADQGCRDRDPVATTDPAQDDPLRAVAE